MIKFCTGNCLNSFVKCQDEPIVMISRALSPQLKIRSNTERLGIKLPQSCG
jgi:hypothetical protein